MFKRSQLAGMGVYSDATAEVRNTNPIMFMSTRPSLCAFAFGKIKLEKIKNNMYPFVNPVLRKCR